jgi:hypothetical protein
MSNVDISNDGLIGLDYDSRGYLQHSGSQTWPVAVDQSPQRTDAAREIPSFPNSGHAFDHSVPQDPNLMVDWQFQQLPSHLQYRHEDPSSAPQYSAGSYAAMPVQSSPVDFMSQSQMSSGLLDGSYLSLPAPVDMVPYYHDLQTDLMAIPHGLPDMPAPYAAPQNVVDSSSPTDTYLEVRSLGSSSSDQGWSTIEPRNSIDFFPEQGIFINPTQTLHDRSLSESSYSTSLGSFVEVSNPANSPTSDTILDSPFNPVNRRVSSDHTSHGSQSPTAVSPVAMVRPIPVPNKKSSSPSRSPTSQSSASSSASPPSRKPSRRSPIAAKTADTKVRKQSQSGKADSEKRNGKIGKRKGPLKPDQRKQASEIRKLRACLRCKFLKKTVSISLCLIQGHVLTADSATRASPVAVASRPMLDYGRSHAPGLTSRT